MAALVAGRHVPDRTGDGEAGIEEDIDDGTVQGYVGDAGGDRSTEGRSERIERRLDVGEQDRRLRASR